LKLKILRIEILDMSYGDYYVIVELGNIGSTSQKHPEYPHTPTQTRIEPM